MKTLTTRNPFWELDEVQNRLGSFFTVLFAHGSGGEFYEDFSQTTDAKVRQQLLAETNKKKEPEMPSGIIR